MMVYISVSLKQRNKLDKELNAIMQVLSDFNLTPFNFHRQLPLHYRTGATNEQAT